MGSELFPLSRTITRSLLSPSHTVGLERRTAVVLREDREVAIPHGGLRTDALVVFQLRIRLQGRHPTRWARNLGEQKTYGRSRSMSPSHTVGSEPRLTGGAFKFLKCRHPTLWARNEGELFFCGGGGPVAIPHGGLRTRRWATSPLKPNQVAIPHGGLRT